MLKKNPENVIAMRDSFFVFFFGGGGGWLGLGWGVFIIVILIIFSVERFYFWVIF